jgi:branched-chain amino acid transport system substrate-binding protein
VNISGVPMNLKLVALIACLSIGLVHRSEAAPLKIALIDPLTGPLADNGKIYEAATKFAFERLNKEGGFNKLPIVLMIYDDAGNPSAASDRFREAVAGGAQIIIGSLTSALTGQLSEDTRRYNLRNPGSPVLFINQGSEASDLTGAKCHFYSFRFTTTATMRAKALLGVMKRQGVLDGGVFSINQNYSFGQDTEAAVKEGSESLKFKVSGSALHDMFRIQDFTPYASRVRDSGASAVVTSSFGSDLLLLIKSMNESGLKATFGTVFLDQPGNLASGGAALAGSYNSATYNVGSDKTSMPAEFKAKVGHYPLYQVDGGVVSAVSFLGTALKAVSRGPDSPVEIKEIALAIEKAKFSGPLGEVSMRADDHQMQMPLAVTRVQEDSTYPVDGTKWGFSTVQIIPGQDLMYPVQESCKMQRRQ